MCVCVCVCVCLCVCVGGGGRRAGTEALEMGSCRRTGAEGTVLEGMAAPLPSPAHPPCSPRHLRALPITRTCRAPPASAWRACCLRCAPPVPRWPTSASCSTAPARPAPVRQSCCLRGCARAPGCCWLLAARAAERSRLPVPAPLPCLLPPPSPLPCLLPRPPCLPLPRHRRADCHLPGAPSRHDPQARPLTLPIHGLKVRGSRRRV